MDWTCKWNEIQKNPFITITGKLVRKYLIEKLKENSRQIGFEGGGWIKLA